jgi:hypothetical protein
MLVQLTVNGVPEVALAGAFTCRAAAGAEDDLKREESQGESSVARWKRPQMMMTKTTMSPPVARTL